jgi:hypothetical protein
VISSCPSTHSKPNSANTWAGLLHSLLLNTQARLRGGKRQNQRLFYIFYFSMYYWTHMFLSHILGLCEIDLSYFFTVHVRLASRWGCSNSSLASLITAHRTVRPPQAASPPRDAPIPRRAAPCPSLVLRVVPHPSPLCTMSCPTRASRCCRRPHSPGDGGASCDVATLAKLLMLLPYQRALASPPTSVPTSSSAPTNLHFFRV